MATKDEARAHWKRIRRGFKEATPVRIAWTGTGWGTAASDFYHPKANYIWVRDTANRPFPVLNRGAVGPRINVPVFLGYTDVEPEKEQVLGVDYDSLIPGDAGDGSAIFNIGPHHQQHEWYGGDEVFIDSRQIRPGLVKPTIPPSMQASVNHLTYFAETWKHLGSQVTADLSSYKPTGDNMRALTVAINLNTNSLTYIPGDTFQTGTSRWDLILEGIAPEQFEQILPQHAAYQKPLAAVLLTASTNEINWTTVTDNILDLRYDAGFTGSVSQYVADLRWRMDEVERRTGFDPRLTTIGAATSMASHYRANSWMLQGVPISTTTPTGSQFLIYDSNALTWKPQTISTAASEQHFSVTIGTSNTWNNELIPIWQGPRGMSVTLVEVLATTSGTSTRELGFDLEHRDWNTMTAKGNSIFGGSKTATSAGEMFTTFARSTIDPRAHLMFTTGSAAEAGSVNYLQLTISYTRGIGFS